MTYLEHVEGLPLLNDLLLLHFPDDLTTLIGHINLIIDFDQFKRLRPVHHARQQGALAAPGIPDGQYDILVLQLLQARKSALEHKHDIFQATGHFEDILLLDHLVLHLDLVCLVRVLHIHSFNCSLRIIHKYHRLGVGILDHTAASLIGDLATIFLLS